MRLRGEPSVRFAVISSEPAKRIDLDGGPDANKRCVGGPASCEEAAKRCTSLTWTVGPTLIKGDLYV